jgi:hypothetical protein
MRIMPLDLELYVVREGGSAYDKGSHGKPAWIGAQELAFLAGKLLDHVRQQSPRQCRRIELAP